MLWQLRPGARKERDSDKASAMFQDMLQEGGDVWTIGVAHGRMSWKWIPFDFAGYQFGYAPWQPFMAGMLIALVSSALGIGGGFLLVPFMAQWLGLPMYIVAGTAAFTIIISSSTSVLNYLYLGVELDWPMLGLLLVGTAIGAILGPRLGTVLPERILRGILALILLFIGIRYTGLLP